ncbi:MAG: hypothetical protein JWM85_599 [Acidimicrobiaceae bacterium]|nr:hypothetical protein [Acidimicrobiaceae bacterium]
MCLGGLLDWERPSNAHCEGALAGESRDRLQVGVIGFDDDASHADPVARRISNCRERRPFLFSMVERRATLAGEASSGAGAWTYTGAGNSVLSSSSCLARAASGPAR